MRIETYTKAALQFAKDTAEWGGIDKYKFYMTTGYADTGYDWVESTNDDKGLDVSWAFHLEEKEIKEMSPSMFLEIIRSMLEQAIEEKWDTEQLSFILECIDY